VRYSVTEAWNLNSAVDGKKTTSKLAPQKVEQWVRPDGSGQEVQTNPDRAPSTDETSVDSARNVRAFSTDPTILARQIGVWGHLDHGAAGYLETMFEVWTTTPPTPGVQAAMLRLIAAQPGLQARGTVKDRAGRSGVAVAAESDAHGLPARHTVILDPKTGMLLSYEEELTGDTGKLNVPTGTVLTSEVWTTVGWVKDVGQKP
jgi:hypothetical protein